MRQVKSLVKLDGLLTKDQIYTVISETKGFVTVIDDRGEQCAYSDTRFEPIHSPKATPDFSQMQYIADEVKITCPVVEEAEARKAQPKQTPVPLPAATDVPYDANGGHITLSNEDFDKLVEDLESDLPPSPVLLSARIQFLSLKLQDSKKEVDRLTQVLEDKNQEIDVLRRYGNKDCTAMADDELERIKKEGNK